MDVEATCPSCGEPITLVVDVSAGRRQVYVEDCWVCCRPMEIAVVVHGRRDVEVDVRAADE